jgi:hypothetical protein
VRWRAITPDRADFLFLYKPIELYAVHKEVDYGPYLPAVLDLHELSVTGEHGSLRQQKVSTQEP